MIVFIPTTDYSDNANDATTINALDAGFVKAGQSTTVAFRVGNTGDAVQILPLSVDHGAVSLSVDAVTLQPGGCSDTLTATITAPLDCLSTVETATILAGTTTLVLSWATVGANVDRLPQTPDRTGPFTDNVNSVLDRVGEALRIYRFDPIAYDPADTSVFVQDGQVKRQADICCRLDPLNTRWGYTQSTETILASFQSEEWEATEVFTQSDTSVSWQGSAVLFIPAEYELVREWASFAPANGVDADQYKRSVFLTQRQGQVWCLQTIVPVYRGEDLAYWSCRLLPLSDASPENHGYYNPFSITYEEGSDRPYAFFNCSPSISFTEIIQSDQSP